VFPQLGHTQFVLSVAFSPDGRQILSGSSNNTVRLCDVTSGKELAQFISFSGRDTQPAVASRGTEFTENTEIGALLPNYAHSTILYLFIFSEKRQERGG